MKDESTNGESKERRAGDDRRKGDRRDPERNKHLGVLTTRATQRRRSKRRAKDHGGRGVS